MPGGGTPGRMGAPGTGGLKTGGGGAREVPCSDMRPPSSPGG